jgi:hypothetical protein
MLQIIGMGPPARYSWLLNLLFGQVMEMGNKTQSVAYYEHHGS